MSKLGKQDKNRILLMQNNKTYISYRQRLMGLAISMFEWKNLPDTIDERFMEEKLMFNGQVVFFKDEALGFLALPVAIGGTRDVYNIPTVRRAYASNGYNNVLNKNNSIIIYNNVMKTNSILDIDMYSERLYNVERTLDVNVNAQKTPTVISCTEEQRLSFINLMAKYEGFEPFLWTDKFLDMNQIKVHKTDAPFIANELQKLKQQIWNEALTVLGIANLSTDKKERMVSDEVDLNMGSVIAQQYIRLNPRKQACEQINRMFGTDISVDFRNDVVEVGGSEIRPEETEVTGNE